MKALVRISVIVCIIYGAIMFALYERTRSEALEQSLGLLQVEAIVVSTERCPGKGLCYITVAEYKINGNSMGARVLGEIGSPGTALSIFIIPGSEKGFLSRAAYIEQATAFLPILFLPLIVFLFPLVLTVAQKYGKPDHLANQGKHRA